MTAQHAVDQAPNEAHDGEVARSSSSGGGGAAATAPIKAATSEQEPPQSPASLLMTPKSGCLLANESKKKNYKIMYDPDLQPKGVPKGKKPIYRFDGESSSRQIVAEDPRKKSSKYGRHTSKGKKTWVNSLRIPQFHYDQNSVGPAPASQILVSGLSTLTTAEVVALHFKPFGDIKDMEIKVDPMTGASLGLCRLRFRSSSSNKSSGSFSAKQAVDKGNGMKIGLTRITVELDEDESKCNKLVDTILAKRRASAPPLKPVEKVVTALQDQIDSPRREQPASPLRKGLRSTPPPAPRSEMHRYARVSSRARSPPPLARYRDRSYDEHKRRPPMHLSLEGQQTSSVLEEIGNDPYLFIPDESLPVRHFSVADLKRRLQRDDWRTILNDDKGFYVVFRSLRAAQACQTNADATRMGGHRLCLILHKPSVAPVMQMRKVDPEEIATNMIIKQLREVFIKDIKTRVAAPALYEFLDPVRYGKEARPSEPADDRESVSTPKIGDSAADMQAKLPLLPRFKKRPTERGYRPKGARPMHQMLNFYDSDESDASTRNRHESDSEDTRVDSRSVSAIPEYVKERKKKSKIKKRPNNFRLRDYLSSEDEEHSQKGHIASAPVKQEEFDFQDSIVSAQAEHRKGIDFTTSEEDSDEAAEQALLDSLMEPLPPVTGSEDNISDFEEKKKPTKKQKKVRKVKKERREELVEFEAPREEVKAPSPLLRPEIIDEGADIVLDLDGIQSLVKDDEDLMYLREALADVHPADIGNVALWAWKQKEVKAINLEGFKGVLKAPKDDGYFRPNPTGAARTEGYFSIPEADKSEYLPHRKKISLPPGVNTSTRVTSRGTRVTNRRFAADLEAQKAMLGSETDVLRFNQLKKRKKPVRFDRSHIHGWGLFAIENIDANDMIIEYVGEMIRQQVADRREKAYLRKGIGSSYLFRIDEATVIDATKKGGIARFINHCCTPNCTAKIIKVEGTRRIVIYALRDIKAGEELTYDYKFEREIGGDRIPCLCGSSGCKGFLN